MRHFLITFLSVYGAAHAYALAKARQSLGLSRRTTALAAAAMLFLALSPMAVRSLDGAGYPVAERVLAWISSLWMGYLFFLTWTNLLVDGANLAAKTASRFASERFPLLIPSGRRLYYVMCSLSASFCVWGLYEATAIRTERVELATSKLPPGVERVRIVQVSDVHLGAVNRMAAARRVAAAVERAKPDLFVVTGDLPDASPEQLDGLYAPFARLSAPLGKYAVTGNHEYYAGIGNSLDFLRKAGFTVLRGEEASPGGKVRLVGVSDRTATRFDGEGARREVDAAPILARPSPLYTVLLRHQPLTPPEEAGRFDLQLSGHTHNGQIWPFRYASRVAYPVGIGVVPLTGGATLYVNRGAGTWGPPMRFLTPPEVTVVDLVRAAPGGKGA